MQHIIGAVYRNNPAELIDDETLGRESYIFAGLQAAIVEGHKRFSANPDILKINIYQVLDGVKRASPQGRYILVQSISRTQI